MKDTFAARQIVERLLHNPTAQRLCIEDERFFDALDFATTAAKSPIHKADLDATWAKMHMLLNYYTARDGGFSFPKSIAQISLIQGADSQLDLDRTAVMLIWRAWLLVELESHTSTMVDGGLILHKWLLDKPLVRRIEQQQAAHGYRKEIDFFADSYLLPPQDSVEVEMLDYMRSTNPILFQAPVAFST